MEEHFTISKKKKKERKTEDKVLLVGTLKYRKESHLSPTNIKNGMTATADGHQ